MAGRWAVHRPKGTSSRDANTTQVSPERGAVPLRQRGSGIHKDAAPRHRSILLTDFMSWNSRNLYDSDVMRRDMLTLVEQGGGAWKWYAVIARWAGYAGSRRCFIRRQAGAGSAKLSVGKTSRIA